MINMPIASIQAHFSTLPDPRRDDSRTRHKLPDMIVIAICAVICGADSWVSVESFGHAKFDYLSRFLELPHGPSHDTFGRVFGLIDSTQFEHCFINWISHAILSDGEVVAVELRRSYDTSTDKAPIHFSAWASRQSVTLGQLKVADHSNEIPAIPQLLEVLAISGCIVTTDAIGCQVSIAQKIVDCGADYIG